MKQDAGSMRHLTIPGKAELRAAALLRRDGLSPDFRAAASQLMAAHALPLFGGMPKASVVAGFFPMRSEIDPRPLMQALVEQGVMLALPAVTPEGLVFRRWTYGDPLAKRRFGLSEPLESASVLDPMAFIVPLAAFDRRGHRIGYGAGYYDRALSQHPDALKIGIGFATQEIAAVPDEPHDHALDAVVTEEGVVKFSA